MFYQRVGLRGKPKQDNCIPLLAMGSTEGWTRAQAKDREGWHRSLRCFGAQSPRKCSPGQQEKPLSLSTTVTSTTRIPVLIPHPQLLLQSPLGTSQHPADVTEDTNLPKGKIKTHTKGLASFSSIPLPSPKWICCFKEAYSSPPCSHSPPLR